MDGHTHRDKIFGLIVGTEVVINTFFDNIKPWKYRKAPLVRKEACLGGFIWPLLANLLTEQRESRELVGFHSYP